MIGINKEYEMWVDELNKRELHIRMMVEFDSSVLEEVLNDINNLTETTII